MENYCRPSLRRQTAEQKNRRLAAEIVAALGKSLLFSIGGKIASRSFLDAAADWSKRRSHIYGARREVSLPVLSSPAG